MDLKEREIWKKWSPRLWFIFLASALWWLSFCAASLDMLGVVPYCPSCLPFYFVFFIYFTLCLHMLTHTRNKGSSSIGNSNNSKWWYQRHSDNHHKKVYISCGAHNFFLNFLLFFPFKWRSTNEREYRNMLLCDVSRRQSSWGSDGLYAVANSVKRGDIIKAAVTSWAKKKLKKKESKNWVTFCMRNVSTFVGRLVWDFVDLCEACRN